MKAKSVYATGTMRSGGSLFQNFMSVNSEIIIFSGFVNFFRYYDSKYGKLDIFKAKQIIEHLALRLQYRRGYNLDTVEIFSTLTSLKNICYKDVYRAIMNHLSIKASKTLWGEYVTMGWRNIPKYLDYFPEGKAIHIIRDPRAVITSFGRMSIMPEGYYLNSIFNCYDSILYSQKYKSTLPTDRYKVINFEEIHISPEKTIRDICDFLEIEFEEIMIQSEFWKEKFDSNFVSANISAYSNEKVYGFDVSRTNKWKETISELELFVCDLVLSDLDYKYNSDTNYSHKEINQYLKILNNLPFMKDYLVFLNTGYGSDNHVLDPTDPKNWDSDSSITGKFKDSPEYDLYINEYNAILNYGN